MQRVGSAAITQFLSTSHRHRLVAVAVGDSRCSWPDVAPARKFTLRQLRLGSGLNFARVLPQIRPDPDLTPFIRAWTPENIEVVLGPVSE